MLRVTSEQRKVSLAKIHYVSTKTNSYGVVYSNMLFPERYATTCTHADVRKYQQCFSIYMMIFLTAHTSPLLFDLQSKMIKILV